MMREERTLDMALQNADRIRKELPQLVQPSNTDIDMVILADEIDLLRRELKVTRGALAYAIEEADGWHDDARGGPVDTPEMDAARELLGK